VAGAAVAGVFLGGLIWGGALGRTLPSHEFWFEADTPRVLEDLTDPRGNHYRSSVHPIVITLTMPIGAFLVRVLHLTPFQAALVLNAATAGLWLAAIFATLRLIGCSRRDALALALLAGASSGAMFWFLVPETYPMGSLSIVACLLVAARCTRVAVPDLVMCLAAAFSLGITITDWMAGWALTLFNRKLKRAVLILAGSLLLVAGVSVAQKALFRLMFSNRNLGLPYPRALAGESDWVYFPDASRLLEVTRAALLHSVVMPSFTAYPRVGLSVQSSPAFSSNWVASTAVVLWGVLLAAGLLRLVWGNGPIRFRLVVGSVLLAQLMMHELYGPETFLYALNFVPLLFVTAGIAMLDAGRRVLAALAVAAAVLTLGNNLYQFDRAVRSLSEFPAAQRSAVIESPSRRP
jgi:hypothetical protein